jgi:hypothetical protein
VNDWAKVIAGLSVVALAQLRQSQRGAEREGTKNHPPRHDTPTPLPFPTQGMGGQRRSTPSSRGTVVLRWKRADGDDKFRALRKV